MEGMKLFIYQHAVAIMQLSIMQTEIDSEIDLMLVEGPHDALELVVAPEVQA